MKRSLAVDCFQLCSRCLCHKNSVQVIERLIMKRNFNIKILLFFICLCIISCKEPPRPNGAWFGNITRNFDQRILSPVAMYFSGDTLMVYSNAITGKYILYLRDKEYKDQENSNVTTDIYRRK